MVALWTSVCLQAPSIMQPAVCWACAGWLLCSSTGSVVCCWSVPAHPGECQATRPRILRTAPIARFPGGSTAAEGVNIYDATHRRKVLYRPKPVAGLAVVPEPLRPHPPVPGRSAVAGGLRPQTADANYVPVGCVAIRSATHLSGPSIRSAMHLSGSCRAIRSATHLSGSCDPQCYASVGIVRSAVLCICRDRFEAHAHDGARRRRS
jgi:hypothetical protein